MAQITDGQVQTIIALVGLIFTVMVATLGFVIRATMKWAKVETNLEALARNLDAMALRQAEAQAAMYQTMREDRAATNERLLFLERKANG